MDPKELAKQPSGYLSELYTEVKKVVDALENEKNKLVEGQKDEGRDPKAHR